MVHGNQTFVPSPSRKIESEIWIAISKLSGHLATMPEKDKLHPRRQKHRLLIQPLSVFVNFFDLKFSHCSGPAGSRSVCGLSLAQEAELFHHRFVGDPEQHRTVVAAMNVAL